MKTLFLDRDGVLNPLVEQDGERISPQHPAQFELLPGVPTALEEAKEAGFQLIVVTNQPDVGKAWRPLTRERLDTMHTRLEEHGIDAVYACTHGPYGDKDDYTYEKEGEPVCDCRKPRPGLLQQAVAEHDVTVPRSYVIGDTAVDMAAAERFEQEYGQVFAGKIRISAEERTRITTDSVASRCPDAVSWILQEAGTPG